jgi:hypothetical protein
MGHKTDERLVKRRISDSAGAEPVPDSGTRRVLARW